MKIKIKPTPDEAFFLTRLAKAEFVTVDMRGLTRDYSAKFVFEIGLKVGLELKTMIFFYQDGSIVIPYNEHINISQCAQEGFYPDLFIKEIDAAMPDFFSSYLEMVKTEMEKRSALSQVEFMASGVLDKTTP